LQLNIANPATGCQKLYEFDDERKLRIFYDKRIAAEVEVDALGEEFKGYVMKITGGNDKQGFAMVQGVMLAGRVRLLLDLNSKCYRPRRPGERKRKSVRGCIVGPDLAVLNLIIVKKGEKDLPGLTDKEIPQRLGPKRASKIRKLFNLDKQDDVRKYVVRRVLPKKEGKRQRTKAPKIQRLVTPRVLQHKRRRIAMKIAWAKKSREDAAEYAKLLAKKRKETQSKRKSLISARRSSKKSVATDAKPAAGEGKTDKKGSAKKPAVTKKAVPAKGGAAAAKKAAGGAKTAKAGLAKPAAPKKGAAAAKKVAAAKKAKPAPKAAGGAKPAPKKAAGAAKPAPKKAAGGAKPAPKKAAGGAKPAPKKAAGAAKPAPKVGVKPAPKKASAGGAAKAKPAAKKAGSGAKPAPKAGGGGGGSQKKPATKGSK